MAYVIYDGQKIIPAPILGISKKYINSQDGQKIGAVFNLVLRGKLLPCKGSPMSTGEFWSESDYPPDETTTDKFKSLLAKIRAMRQLFSQNGLALEIMTAEGYTPIKCYPVVIGMDFPENPENPWVDYVDYTISLETPVIYGLEDTDEDFGQANFVDANGNRIFLSEASEEWSLEITEPGSIVNEKQHTFKLQHVVSAAGKVVYTDDGFVRNGYADAKTWATERLGLDSEFWFGTPVGISGNISDYHALNHMLVENTNVVEGRYSATETWTIVNGATYIETVNIVLQSSIDNGGLNAVSVDGSIAGLEDYNNGIITTNKFENATIGWNIVLPLIYSRALQYGIGADGYLHPTPLNTQVAKNPINGTITYSYNYNSRPTNCVENSLYENIVINDTNPSDVFAVIPIIGILQ